MLNWLPGPVKGVLAFILIGIHTLILVPLLLIAAFFKLIIPWKHWRKACDVVIVGIATFWITLNNSVLRLFNRIEWDVEGLDDLARKDWYLVLSNHQSWTDILVLQRIFNRKVPFLKFFLKEQLRYVPVMGLAWWALDFPFMKRYSKAKLAKKPHLAGKDLTATIKACRKFKNIPISVMNFVEGTRFSPNKKAKQDSPYDYLLKPKAAGIAITMAAMGEHMNKLLDVTIAYPKGVDGMWGLLCGKVNEIKVQVQAMPISTEHIGDYFNDLEFRQRFQEWLNELWEEKDRRLAMMLS